MKTRLLILLALVLEPAIHLTALLTGVVIPHPEGLGTMAMNMLATED